MGTREVVTWHDTYKEEAVRDAERELQRQHEEDRQRDRDRRDRAKQERDRRERQEREAREQQELNSKMSGLRSSLTDGLKTYQVGSKTNIAKQGIDHVNIAMFGPTGSGKSSFINIAEKVLLGKTTVITQSDAKEGTIILLEFLPELNFHLFDTRGFFDVNKSMHKELDNILTGKIRPSQVIVRDEEEGSLPEGQAMRTGPVPLKDRMHAVICLLGHKDPKEYSDKMKNIRASLKEEGYSPVGALAFINEADFVNSDKRESLMVKMSASMGSPRDRTYAFINHLATETEVSAESAINVMDILDTALIAAEGYIKVQQQREKYAKERAKPKADAAAMSIKDFIEQIGEEHKWDEKKVNSALQLLEDEDIYDVAGLKQFWDDVKPKLSIGMRSAIQNALFPK